MSLRRFLWILAAVLVLAPLALFWWQNSDTRVNVLFSLGGAMAWDLGPEGLPLPTLLLLALGLGGLCTAGVFGLKSFGWARSKRGLERQVSVLQEELDFARRQLKDRSVDNAATASTGSASSDASLRRLEEDTRSFDDLI